MSFATRSSIDETRWNLYRQLELLPESVPNPAKQGNSFTSRLNVFWRSLLGLLIDELVEDQRVEYLDRCWSLNEFGESEKSSNSLHRLWVLME